MNIILKILIFIAIVLFAVVGTTMITVNHLFPAEKISKTTSESIKATEKALEGIRQEKESRTPTGEMCSCSNDPLQYYCFYGEGERMSPIAFIVEQVPDSCDCSIDVADVKSLGFEPCIL